MRIAILSDTHDNAANTLAALALLAPHKPAAYLHCGDLCAPEMLAHFSGLPFYFVFGNNDYDHTELRAEAKSRGLHCLGAFGDLTLAGKKIAILHGDDFAPLRSAMAAQPFDYIFSGHTHLHSDTRAAGGARLINPGALHRAATKSVALLDLTSDALTFLNLPARKIP